MMRNLVMLGLLALSACSSPAPTEQQSDDSADAPAAMSSPVPMHSATPSKLVQAFEDNEVAAMRDYGSGPILLTGKVRGVVLDMSDDPAVLFESGRQRPVQALFDKERGQATASFKKGAEASVICNELREVLGNPILDDCWVDDPGRTN